MYCVFRCLFEINLGKGCGGRLLNIEGMVTSPLYPLMFRKNATCRWDIAVPRPHPIVITFQGMSDKKKNIVKCSNVFQKNVVVKTACLIVLHSVITNQILNKIFVSF